MDFEDLQKVVQKELIKKVYKPFQRYTLYCPVVNKNRVANKSNQPKVKKSRIKCSNYPMGKKRDNCKKAKVQRCKARRIQKGKSALNQPCTSAERKTRDRLRRRKKSKDKKNKKDNKRVYWPWDMNENLLEVNCHGLTMRSDRKMCHRIQRKECRDELKERLPGFRIERVNEICRAQVWLNRCKEKRTKMNDESADLVCRKVLKQRVKVKNGITKDSKNRKAEKKMLPKDVKHLA